jgi:ubiquinone/menaquinone biosynthesis C-methylase UbiE
MHDIGSKPRGGFIQPHAAITAMHLDEGMRVADLGAGTGAFSIAAAERVGQSGRVYAIEVRKELLEKIQRQAREQRCENVDVFGGDIEVRGGTRLNDNAVGAVILSNVLFQVEDTNGLLQEIQRILKPEGQVLVIDWRDSFGDTGPPPEQLFPREKAAELFERHGFELLKTIEPGEHHYGMVYKYKQSV